MSDEDVTVRCRFERLTRSACRVAHAPWAFACLADEHGSSWGTGAEALEGLASWHRTPLGRTLCEQVEDTGRPLAVADLGASPWADDGLESAPHGVVACLGVPLTSSRNGIVGSLWVADMSPRSWTESDVAALVDLADMVTVEIDLRGELAERERVEIDLEMMEIQARRRSEELAQALAISQTEIAERERVEKALADALEALREKGSVLRGIHDNSPMSIAIVEVFDDDILMISANPAMVHLCGRPIEMVEGHLASELGTPPNDIAWWIERYRACALSRCTEQFAWRFESSRGTMHFLAAIGPVAGGTPERPRFFLMLEDITERARAEEALRESERFNRSLLDSLSSHIAVLDATGTIVAVNQSWRDFGQPGSLCCPSLTEGASYLGMHNRLMGQDAEVADAIAAGIRDVLAGRRNRFTYEYPLQCPGEPRWFLVRITPFAGEGPARVVVSHQNITERKRAEDEIRRLNARLELRLERIAALRQIDMAITASLDLRLTLGIVIDQVRAQLGVDAAAVLLCEPSTQDLRYATGRGFRTDGILRSRLRLGEGLAGRAALERHMIHIPDLSQPDIRRAYVRAPLMEGEDFTAYAAVPLVAKGQIKGVLEIYQRTSFTPESEWSEFLETLAGQAAIAIDNASLFENLQRSNIELTLAYDATIEGWSRALDLRDRETEGHARRVTELTLRLARAVGIDGPELVHIRRGALLHDIGKMGIPDAILHKPGPLEEWEQDVMRLHPTYAFEMLAPISFLGPALDIPYCHHEKWDGTGYPRGLEREQIPLSARIFAVADIWDALRSDRPYRESWSDERVRKHLWSLAGSHLDPALVRVFLEQIPLDEPAGDSK